jgi:hypothetical protein
VPFAVRAGEVAWPFAPVVTVEDALPPKLALAPDAGAVNVTLTPDSGLPPESFTNTTSGFANGELMAAVCPPPLNAAMLAAAPAVFVSENVVERAPVVAVTLYDPTLPLAVNAGDTACPSAPVTTVAAPPNDPLGPDAGALNVTLAPETGLPPASFTIATNGNANAVLICADCGLPLTTAMVAADPTLFVSEKIAPVAAPALAVT